MVFTEAPTADRAANQNAAARPNQDPAAGALRLARRLKLKYTAAEALTIRRVRRGERFSYADAGGVTIRKRDVLARLKGLAVPPAYEDVLYAEDPRAHLQAVGRDAAGRLQYRYHAEWQKVRETRKAARLARLAEALPRIRRSIGQHLAGREPTREFALAAVIELVARSAIRSGSESHARLRGTRGAATLLKSNVMVAGEAITLKFRAKGAKQVRKEFTAIRLAEAVAVLRALPGRRLFQYRGESGQVRMVTAQEVNGFLREIAGVHISLKDFRTLLASVQVLGALAAETPGPSKRARRRQVLDAIRAAATELANTPAICAKSYVHEAVVTAFEEGILEQFAETLRRSRSPARREQVLAQVVATAAEAA
ncbi:MAG: DNA topoisomerase IB [Variibacter sp.]|nr:DNA topoisomerase IB [Variibacter sp.]